MATSKKTTKKRVPKEKARPIDQPLTIPSDQKMIATEVLTRPDYVDKLRVPAHLFDEYIQVLAGQQAGDKSQTVIAWCRAHFTPEEFDYKYAHRGIK